MILLDTNVLSEVMKGDGADQVVVAWVWDLKQPPATTVFNRAEILAGIALLPVGRRRDELARVAHTVLDQIGVCVPFTPECAASYAHVVAERQRDGRPISTMDALIAATARELGASLATRNVRDFDGLGLHLLDPWSTA